MALFFIVLFAACAPVHQVVRVKTLKDEAGEKKNFYGVTYNHMLIPEYTKSAADMYVGSKDEALSLMNQRSTELDAWIGNKYKLTNSTFYQLTAPIPKLGLAVTAPFAIPVEWMGERFFPDPTLGGRRSFKQLTQDYFEPTYDEPVLKQIGPLPVQE